MNRLPMTYIKSNRHTNPFKHLPIALSWLIALAFGIALVGFVVGAILTVTFVFGLPFNTFGFMVAVCVVNLLLPFWLLLADFLTTPLFQLLNVHTYYSPMLIATRIHGSRLAIHGGTLFDYVKHLRWVDRGGTAKRQVLGYYFQGMLALIKDIEEERIAGNTIISAKSYFFSPKNAERLGFTVKAKGLPCALGGILTYSMLILTYSYAKGRLSFPNLSHTVDAQILSSELVQNKEKLMKLASRFS